MIKTLLLYFAAWITETRNFFLLAPCRNINTWFLCICWVWCTFALVLLGSAVNMSVFLPTSINNESKAPLCVPDSTAPQQHLLIVQGIFVSSKSKSSCEFIQFVIWCLTSDFSCKKKVKEKMEILVQKRCHQYCISSCSSERQYFTL